MSHKKDTLWAAPPHTVAKITMLRKYLRVWFEILGRRANGRDVWYIDGFAGPGEYTDYPDGSPIAAIKGDLVMARVITNPVPQSLRIPTEDVPLRLQDGSTPAPPALASSPPIRSRTRMLTSLASESAAAASSPCTGEA